MKKKLIIIGDSFFAQIAYKYFFRENKYQIVGFSVEKQFIKNKELYGLPIVEFENLDKDYSPSDYYIFVAITYTKLNTLRTRLFNNLKEKGYRFVNYISPHAYLDEETEIGENVFIFENNTIQPFVKIRDNCILWSGNHIGHHSLIEDNVFISSHVVISGFCKIGKNSFLGVNSTIINGVSIGENNLITEGTIISSNTEKDSIYKSSESKKSKVSASKFFKLK